MLLQQTAAIGLKESQLGIGPDGLLQFIVGGKMAVQIVDGYLCLTAVVFFLFASALPLAISRPDNNNPTILFIILFID